MKKLRPKIEYVLKGDKRWLCRIYGMWNDNFCMEALGHSKFSALRKCWEKWIYSGLN